MNRQKTKKQNLKLQKAHTMKKLLTTLSLATLVAGAANAQVYINEIMNNPPGTDSPFEYFELRGTPGMSLAGYYLLEVEGNYVAPGITRGDVGQFFDLSAYSIGANGFFVAFQKGATYGPTIAGATVIMNGGTGVGWGTTANSTIGHVSDGTQTDLENSTTTLLLINRNGGAAPTVTDDLDTNDDGLLDLPALWLNVDSVGLIDGTTADPASFSYGAITFRLGGAAAGGSAYGNIIDIAGPNNNTMYAGRKGDSTGTTADDWVGSLLTGTGPGFSFLTPSDPFYTGRPISDMQFGGTNVVPEPTAIALSSIGLLALWVGKRRSQLA